jgi:hypothetical protein
MALKFYAAGACAAVIAMVALAGPPAEAAPKKKGVTNHSQVVTTHRARTRIRVERRSFLDGGTEVLPGERKFTDYAFPPGTAGSPASMMGIENTAFYHRGPLPGPFELPGRQNPWPWNWCVGC